MAGVTLRESCRPHLGVFASFDSGWMKMSIVLLTRGHGRLDRARPPLACPSAVAPGDARAAQVWWSECELDGHPAGIEPKRAPSLRGLDDWTLLNSPPYRKRG